MIPFNFLAPLQAMRGHEFGAAVACYTVALVLVPPEALLERQPNGRDDLPYMGLSENRVYSQL